MLIVPKSRPVLENLNTYYLDLSKMIEHFQGELGHGAIYLSSSTERAVIYFDQEAVLNAILETSKGVRYGDTVLSTLLDSARRTNYKVDVYYIEPSKVYFFAHLTESEWIYRDLSSEFTDLEGLIKKISDQQLTGYIEVLIGGNKGSAYLLFDKGIMIGGSYSWAKEDINNSKENFEELLLKVRETTSMFNVARVTLSKQLNVQRQSPKVVEQKVSRLSPMLVAQELLWNTEQMFTRFVKKADFTILLKKKFVEKADRYPFLDPFAGEFEYSGGKVSYVGETDENQVLSAVLECLNDLVRENKLTSQFETIVSDLKKKYEKTMPMLRLS